jgi:hypothetical protein
MGLQQELYGSRFTESPVRGRSERSTSPPSSQLSYYPLSSPTSQFHSCKETVINDDLSSYHKSDDPLTPFRHYLPHLWARLRAPLLSAMTKMISRICSAIQVIMRHDRRSQTSSLQLLHCQDCIDRQHFYFDCYQYICDHCLMNAPHHQVSDCLNR